MDRNESNEREKQIILRKGSTIRAGQIMSSHILQLLIFFFLFFFRSITSTIDLYTYFVSQVPADTFGEIGL